MKYITVVLLLSYCAINGMELPAAQQKKDNPVEPKYTILPKVLCEMIGVYKTEIEGPVIQSKKKLAMSCPDDPNILKRMSLSWNSLIPKSSADGRCNLWEHQLLYHKNYVGAFKFNSSVQFDTISTGDFNQFIVDKVRREGEHPTIHFKAMFDGPNNDGGTATGVVLVADSYFGERDRKTCFYLFKQHGLSSRNYSGVQEKVTSPDGSDRLVYRGFPNRFKLPKDDQDYYSKDRNLDCCALAPHKRGIIASHTTYYMTYLNVFEYEHTANTTDLGAPDQSFKVNMLAMHSGGPRFIKLAWIYGRTLLGLSWDPHSKDQQLYVIALDEKEGKTSIRVCPQKIGKKITNFCLARPFNHHLVFLCDDQKNIYYANLKYRDRKGAISLKPLMHDGQKISAELERVDKMWAYEDRFALMDAENMKVLLFTLGQKDWTAQKVNEVLQAKKIVRVFPWKEEPYDEYRA